MVIKLIYIHLQTFVVTVNLLDKEANYLVMLIFRNGEGMIKIVKNIFSIQPTF